MPSPIPLYMPSKKANSCATIMHIIHYASEILLRGFRRTYAYVPFRFLVLKPLALVFLFTYCLIVWKADTQRHQYFVAASWSWKTEFIKFLIWREIRKRASKRSALILLDPHGDLAKEVAMMPEFARKKAEDRLVFVDPLLSKSHVPGINPFDMKSKDEDEIAIRTQELKRVFEVLLSGSEPTSAMKTLLHACIATLLRRPWSNLEDLQRFMSDGHNTDLLTLWKSSPNRQHAKFFQDEFCSSDYRLTKRGIYTRLQSLLHDPIFQRLIAQQSSFDLEELINQKKIIIFRLPLWEWGSESMQAYGRFIFGMLRIIALTRSSKKYRVPTYIYIDEFQNFVSDDLENALTQFRKFKMYLLLAHQYPAQKWISMSLQRALLSSWVLVVWRNEYGTLKRIEKHVGIPTSTLQRLRPWRFIVQTNRMVPRRIRVPSYLLGESHRMSDKKWQRVQASQLKNYYSRIKRTSSPPQLIPKYYKTWNTTPRGSFKS